MKDYIDRNALLDEIGKLQKDALQMNCRNPYDQRGKLARQATILEIKNIVRCMPSMPPPDEKEKMT